jgi:hypothetical protein
MLNNLWQISLEDYLLIMPEAIKLGKERGKKEGDNLEQEFMEVAKRLNKLPTHLGATELNKEELIDQYKLAGKTILDLTKKDENK